MSLRGLSAAGVSYLSNNKRFKIVHLVRMETAKSTNTSKQYHTYTDASFPIKFIPQEGDTALIEEAFVPGVITKISGLKEVQGVGLHKVSIKTTGIAADQLNKALIPNKDPNSLVEQSYHGKEVRIYRVYLDEYNQPIDVTGVASHPSNTFLTSEPLVVYDGLIDTIKVSENIDRTNEIDWMISNHFADFTRVNGRITDHTAHSGTNTKGDAGKAAKRPEYSTDLGFIHSNQTINVIAEYTKIEKATKLVKKKKWHGMSSSYTTKEVEEEVVQEVDINFNLAGKYLPVVYGVRKVPGIPVFADTPKNDPTKIYLVYAVCEGEIEGFLDINIGGKPVICIADEESDVITCLGNKQTGHTIHDQAVAGGIDPNAPTPPSYAYPAGAPTQHGRQYIYTDDEGEIEFWTYHGKPDQVGAQPLIDVVNDGVGFYRQKDTDYWTLDHKLLDTAYVVVVVNLQDGENGRTEIPEFEFTVSGRKVRQWSDVNNFSDDETTLNPVWQLLDYITSPTFGGGISSGNPAQGIDFSRFDINNLVEVANRYDQTPRNSNGDLTYDPNFVKYWRYVGWKQQAESNMALIEQNTILETNISLFKNIEDLLEQCFCSLVMLNGTYYLIPEEASTPVCHFDFSELSMGVQVVDNTNKVKKNSIKASIQDPAKDFGVNSVTFYNSEYKEADSGIERKGNYGLDFVTNYYCARNLADWQLRKTRYSREITFTVGQKGMLLYPNAIFTLTYDRYGFNTTKFLTKSVSLETNGSVKITAMEYADEIHSLDHGLELIENTEPPKLAKAVAPPREVSAALVTGADGGDVIEVSWKRSISKTVSYYQVWATGNVTGRSIVYSVLPDNTIDSDTTDTLKYTFRLNGLLPDDYKFYVRAVSADSSFSKAIVYPTSGFVTISTTSIPTVTNFRVVNSVPGTTDKWYGPDVLLAWDEATDPLAEGYVLQILSSSSIQLGSDYTINGTENTNFTFSLSDNVSLYNSENGTVGVYDNLKFQIKAIGSSNAIISPTWSKIE